MYRLEMHKKNNTTSTPMLIGLYVNPIMNRPIMIKPILFETIICKPIMIKPI